MTGLFGKTIEEEKHEERLKLYKSMWNEKSIIKFKNERIAILEIEASAIFEFTMAFDDLVKEGYKLRTTTFRAPLHPTISFYFHKD